MSTGKMNSEGIESSKHGQLPGPADMDVGILCHGWFPDAGGVESHTRDIARELLARGHRVHVLCLDYSPDRDPYTVHDSEVEGVHVRRMAYLYQDHRALADVAQNRKAEDVLFAWLAEHPVDVVHVHHLTGWGLGALRAIQDVGRPCVMTLHDYWPLCPRGQMMKPDRSICARPEAATCASCLSSTWGHLMPSAGGEARGPDGAEVSDDTSAAAERTRFALACLGLPERLITPSRRAREVYARAGLPAERVAVLENGVDVDRLREQVAGLRLAASTPGPGLRIGALGTVLPSKGQLEFAQAFLEADLPAASLEIHGALPAYHGDEAYCQELQALAAQHSNIRVHGAYDLEDLAQILSGLDIVVANSRWEEVYGLTVREASAVGLPVLVSDAGDLAAVTEGGRAGLVVPVNDHAAWVTALGTLASDNEAREGWGQSQRSVHSTAEMLDELLVVYADAIRRAGGQVGDSTTAAGAGAGTQVPAAPEPGSDAHSGLQARGPQKKKSWLRAIFGLGQGKKS